MGRLSSVAPGVAERAAERRLRVLECRKAGLSFRDIAKRVGVSAQQAYLDYKRAMRQLAEKEQSSAEEHRTLDLERIDVALAGMWPFIAAGSPKHVAQMARLLEQRAKLLGYAGPDQRIEVGGPDGGPVRFTITLARPGRLGEGDGDGRASSGSG